MRLNLRGGVARGAAGETAELLELEVWNPCLPGVHKHEKERDGAPALLCCSGHSCLRALDLLHKLRLRALNQYSANKSIRRLC